LIAHVVLFEPKADVTPEQRRDFLNEIRSVATEIAIVHQASVGRPLSFSRMPALNSGQPTYSFAAVMTFRTRNDLDVYLTHPRHELLRTMFWNFCQATLIADLDLSDVNSEEADLLV
jgi:Stress responsive A/B Barrel Domain